MSKQFITKPNTRPGKTTPTLRSLAWLVDWVHIIIISVLFWMVYISIFDHKPDMNGDNFAYYLLGKRIATGQGFTNATDIHHAAHTHFSIGYPALIAAIIKTIGDDQDTINCMNGLMMYGSLILLYFIVKRLTSSTSLAFAVTLITSLNSHLLRSATITMSEIPFLFVSMLAILFFIKAIADPRGIRSVWLYLSILCIAGCYYTRTTAVALLAGVILYLLFSRDWQRVAIAMVEFALLALPGYIRDSSLKSSHMGQLMMVNPYNPAQGTLTIHTLAERIQHNLIRYISTDIPSGILSLETNFEKAPFSFWAMGILIIGLVLWGIYRLKDFRLLLLGYIGGTLTILMIWPDVWSGIRFILPLVPIAVFLGLNGIKELFAIIAGKKYTTYLPYAFILMGLLYIKPITVLQTQADQALSPNYTNYFDIAKWAKANTPKYAIFSARKPDMFIYYADRTCVGDKPSADDKEVLDFFRQNNVDYVIIDQLGFSSTGKYLVPAIQKNMEKFEIIYQLKDPDTYLLRFKR